ncbi:MAG: LPS assembly lipoprotein LptE [Acidobacteriota bacterium]
MSRVSASPLSRLALLLVAVAALGGCGYALVGQGDNIPADVRAIYVEPLGNDTARSQVDQILTESVVNELVTRRRFEVVNTIPEADAILSGTVTSFVVRPLTFDDAGLAQNLEIAITADMVFARPPADGEVEGEVLWRNSRYLFREDYVVEDAGLTFVDREDLAIEENADSFAETLVTDLLEGF